MDQAQSRQQATTDDGPNPVHDVDATGYQSMRGCLVLTALVLGCVIVGIVFILLFGEPVE